MPLEQAGSASKQMHPDTATAEPLSPYGADAGILLTMHEQCPWAEDPVDVTAGHAVEDSQGTAWMHLMSRSHSTLKTAQVALSCAGVPCKCACPRCASVNLLQIPSS